MIGLILNVESISRIFDIPLTRLQEYGDLSVSEIMEQEALSGNKYAVNFEENILNDPSKIVKVFELNNAKNIFLILSNMNSTDLLNFLEFLDNEALLSALTLFNYEKLRSVVNIIPKEEMIKVLFNIYSINDFLKLTKERFLDKFLESQKVEKNDLENFLKFLPTVELKRILENVNGKPTESRYNDDLISEVKKIHEDYFFYGLKSIDLKSKIKLFEPYLASKPELFMEFDEKALSFPIQLMEKNTMIENLAILPQETLQNLVQELPKELMPLVISQIDPNVFAKILCKDFSNILSEISIL